jgi:hypothetical protein
MKTIPIPAHEQGTSRLFSMSMDAPTARRIRDDPAKLAAILGLGKVRPTGIEVFRVADLGEFGLVGYLRDGIDAQETDLARDRAKLAGLDGWVMLVHSSAFEGQSVAVKPASELTLIGTYSQNPADTAPIDIESEAAQPYTGTPDVAPAPPPPASKAGSIVVIGLLALAVLLLWWALA